MQSNRIRSFFIVILFSLTVFACSTPVELEGTWLGYEIENPRWEWTLTIQRDRFALACEEGDIWYSGHLELNANCARNKMDLEIHETSIPSCSGKTSFGIYEMEAETLLLVASRPGDGLRPWTFEETRSSVALVFEKRIEEPTPD